MNRIAFLGMVFTCVLAACSKHADGPAPIVAQMKQTTTQNATTTTDATPGKPAGALVSEVTLNKATLLHRTFNYSASLQFSSIVDKDIQSSMMGLSLGEVPATFQIFNGQLQFVTDGSIGFESDLNHPSRLIYEFPILAQTDDTITIRADRASPIMDTFLFGNDNKVQVRYSFLRSMEYVASDELFLIESTVELVNGSVGEYMESIRPRDKTVPAGFADPIYNDAELNPAAGRYMFLDAGDVYVPKKDKPEVRIKTKVAQRFLVKDGQPIQWYVTANIPDAYLADVKNAVEGWNRYSRAAGQPDLTRFMGRLPDGVKVGDPRYNLIVWDTVQDAGAAYESQNSDPITGISSHSMIYLPYAWVNIGKDYWKKAMPDTQDPGEKRAAQFRQLLADRDFLGRRLPVNCIDGAELHLSFLAKENPDQFSHALLKDTLFHEMGHSLGFAHNFKGSLTYDSSKENTPFSDSIMDYNHYDEEEVAFTSLDSSDGPLLEYDRQIVSVLYNGGKDVKASDPTLPSCADAEADSNEGGVDPLCIRYDIGADVTKEALRTVDLFTKPGLKIGRTESISARKFTDALLALPPAANVKDLDAVKAALSTGLGGVSGTLGLYLASGASSFGYMGAESMRVLKVFRDDTLPEGYDANEMRARGLQILQTAAGMNEFPSLVKDSLTVVKPNLMAYLGSTAFVGGLGPDDKTKTLNALGTMIDKSLAKLEVALLSKMRTRFITELVSTPTAPLEFVTVNGATTDVEQLVMNTLAQLASAQAGAGARPVEERAAALTSLKSYARSENYAPIAARITEDLNVEIRKSTDAAAKEAARKLLADFTKASAPAKDDGAGQ